MNKKSKIKTTLDSLFTGGRIKPEDSKQESAVEPGKEKTPPVKKEKKIVQPLEKPVEITREVVKPVDIIKPVEKNSIQDSPVESTPPVSSESVLLEEKQPPKVEGPSAIPSKAVEPRQPVGANEVDVNSELNGDDDEHLVIFTLGKELYGVTIHAVESIIKIQSITEVPRTASYVLGVTNLRGTVVPVLDLRKRFNLQFSETTPNTRIIIVNAEGSKVGIVVDEVTEVLKVAQNSIQPPPPMSTTIESAFINGIAKINEKLVILLDLEKVLASSSRQFNR